MYSSRWVVGMAPSGCMQSAMSSLWQSGRTVQQVNRWSLCSGLKPDQQSSVCSTQPPTSTYGTCWKMTPSPWSPRGFIQTGRVRQTHEGWSLWGVCCIDSLCVSSQGDSHGFVRRLRTTEHIFRNSTGTRVRNDRDAVFCETFHCACYWRREEAGVYDDWSLLKHICLCTAAAQWSISKCFCQSHIVYYIIFWFDVCFSTWIDETSTQFYINIAEEHLFLIIMI